MSNTWERPPTSSAQSTREPEHGHHGPRGCPRPSVLLAAEQRQVNRPSPPSRPPTQNRLARNVHFHSLQLVSQVRNQGGRVTSLPHVTPLWTEPDCAVGLSDDLVL